MQIKEKLREFTEQKRGLLATNFYNLETLHGVLGAAAELKEPLILQLTQSSIDYMGLEMAVSMARTGLKQYGVEGWLHLDHGGSVALAQACLDAGVACWIKSMRRIRRPLRLLLAAGGDRRHTQPANLL